MMRRKVVRQPLTQPRAESVRGRFVLNVERTDSCWLWTAALNRRGYGVTSISRQTYLAHRVAYVLAYGDIPPGFLVCHRCDNPRCVRHEHLFIGTDAVNLADMRAKGRGVDVVPRRGFAHHNAKLSEPLVAQAREHHANGESIRSLARRFGVARTTMRSAILHETWRV